MLRRVSILEAPRPATKIDPGLFRDAGRAITSPGLTLRATTNMPITPERDFCSYPGWRATLRSLGFGQRSVREGGAIGPNNMYLSHGPPNRSSVLIFNLRAALVPAAHYHPYYRTFSHGANPSNPRNLDSRCRQTAIHIHEYQTYLGRHYTEVPAAPDALG